jgi:hypothetical protein
MVITMDDIEEVVRSLEEKYPIAPHTNAGRLFSTIRRMNAEKEVGLPVSRRTGFAISVKDGKPASELDETAWESFYSGLCKELKERYPDLHEQLFSDDQERSEHDSDAG